MNISLEWLKQYVDYQDTPERLDAIITQVGFAVDGVTQVGEDWVFDVDVTSNRPDCLGHVGLAREVAAVIGAEFRLPEASFAESGRPVDDWTQVAIEAPDLCGRYTARVIDKVKVGPSPEWMARRLEAVGIRAISNVVDITNYVMMEVGQPLHSFDYAQLGEGRIVVRRARPGERMEMIDHSMVELGEDNLVIADAGRPVAVAGVMGGLASEVGEATGTVLLESAYFAPLSVRHTARKLGLGSESSFRFERDIDIVTTEWASRRAAALLAECAGGQVAPGVVDVWPTPWRPQTITMRQARLGKLLGIELPREVVTQILQRLGLQPTWDGDAVRCVQPSWRRDLIREVDLIEEVIRIHGYEHIPVEPQIRITVKTQDDYQRTRRQVNETLTACGYFETVSVGFAEDKHIELFAAEGFTPVRVNDFTRKSNNALRPSLLPSLMAARQRNQAVGNSRCDFFELAAVHEPQAEAALPHETIMLALLTDGDFRALRGVLEAMAGRIDKQATLTFAPAARPWAGSDEAAEVRLNDTVIGYAGHVSEEIGAAFDLAAPVCAAEISFAALAALQGAEVKLQPLARFPAITRDLSLVLDESVCWAELQSAITGQGVPDLRAVEFVDLYRGKGVEKGQKSLTLSMTFRRDNETLTHEQVDAQEKQILAALAEKHGATLRT